MKSFATLIGAGLLTAGLAGTAGAQTASGTPVSPFPNAAPHEVVTVNGVPCRTVLNPSTNQREIAECAQPMTTGSIAGVPVRPGGGVASASGTPASPFPNAAPHEVVTFNGMICRTVLNQATNQREIAECVR